MFLKLKMSGEYAQSEKSIILESACAVIGSPDYIGYSILVDGKSDVAQLIEWWAEEVLESTDESIARNGAPYSGNAWLTEPLQKGVSHTIGYLLGSGRRISFAPRETMSGEYNELSIYEDGEGFILEYTGRRHALMDGNNCLGGDYFKRLIKSDKQGQFEVLEYETQRPDAKWYEFGL